MEPVDPQPSLASSAIETFALRALLFGLGIGANIAVSRTLGPDGRGQYALATLSALTVVVVGKVGLEHANIYLLGNLHVAPDRLESQNLLVTLVTGIPGALALLIAPVLLPTLFGDLRPVDLALAAATVPFLLHVQLAAGLQNITGLITWQFRAAIGGAATQLAVVGTLLLINQLDVTSALAAYLAGSIVFWASVLARVHRRFRITIDLPLMRATFRYALIVHVGLVLLFFQTRVTLFLVQGFVGTTGLGYYSLALLIAESILLAGDSLAIALLPRQTAAKPQDSATLSLRTATIGGLLVLAAGVPLVIFGADMIVFVFGAHFAPSYIPVVVLLPGIVALSVQRFCGVPALRANKPVRIAAIHGLGVAINVVLAAWWIPASGIVGAAASTTVSYIVTAGLFLVWTLSLARPSVDANIGSSESAVN